MKDININHLIEVCSAFVQEYYDEHGRYYHNFLHVQSMLNELNKISEFYKQALPPSFILAIIFHDVIYIPGFDKNEEASIQFMKNKVRSFYGTGLEDSLFVAEKYIEGTIYHQFETDAKEELEKVFLDLDLLPLTGDYPTDGPMWDIHHSVFLEYLPLLIGIDQEKARTKFAEGRSEFFKQMLKKKTILRSKIYGHLEASLRKNLQNFIDDPYKYF